MPSYCKVDGCNTTAHFGLPNEKTPTHCGSHGKPLGMINITSKRCKQDGCDSIGPHFGFPDDKSPTYCAVHGVILGMVNIIHKRCLQDGCSSINPKFGHIDDKSPTYCGEHGKPLGMIDIIHKRCLQDGCTTAANFGFPDDKSPTYCSPHGLLLGMINIVSKRCKQDECDKQPHFGFPNDKSPTYCGAHGKPLKMINITSKRCKQDECDSIGPKFGFPGDKNGTYCETHGKPLGMVNIVHKLCETCNSTQMNQKYKPNCSRCHFYLHPDDPRIRNYKTKEQAYMNALLEKFPQFKLDKTIDGGCSKRRPDGFLDLLTHVIIIEIDENEHKSYDDTCNNRRTMELSQDVDHRPIVFIRLNPDSYTLNDKRMKGSFSLTKATGELKVVKKEFNKRLNSLIESVEKYMTTEPDKTILVEYLYFTE